MSQEQVLKSEFKARALELCRQGEATAEGLIITDNGKPTVELRRYPTDQRSALQRLKGSLVFYREPTKPVGAGD